MLHNDLIELIGQYIPYYLMNETLHKLRKDRHLTVNYHCLTSNPHIFDYVVDVLRYPIYLLFGSKSAAPMVAENINHLVDKYTIIMPIEEDIDNPDPENEINMHHNIDTWYNLSQNPAMIEILEKYPEKINWKSLLRNPAAIHLIEKTLNDIDWDIFLQNPECNQICKKYQIDMDIEWRWKEASRSCSVNYLKEHIDKIEWEYLEYNSDAIEIYKMFPEKINWKSAYEIDKSHELIPIAQNLIKTLKCEDRLIKTTDDKKWCGYCKSCELRTTIENAICMIQGLYSNNINEVKKAYNLSKLILLSRWHYEDYILQIFTNNPYICELIKHPDMIDIMNRYIGDLNYIFHNPAIFTPIRNIKYINMLKQILLTI